MSEQRGVAGYVIGQAFLSKDSHVDIELNPGVYPNQEEGLRALGEQGPAGPWRLFSILEVAIREQ